MDSVEFSRVGTFESGTVDLSISLADEMFDYDPVGIVALLAP